MRFGDPQDLSSVGQLGTGTLDSNDGEEGENGDQGETSGLKLHGSIVCYSLPVVNGVWRLVSNFFGRFFGFLGDNRNTVKGIQSLLVMMAFVGVGCGGGGGSASSFMTGDFNGTVIEPGRASAGVELTVDTNGRVLGVCTVLGSTSGAIMGKSVLSGTANLTTGKFHVTGFYQVFIPPPPGGGGTGVVNVDGTLPANVSSAGTILVDDNGITFSGALASNNLGNPL